MTLPEWITLVGAVVGSSGVTALVTVLVGWSQSRHKPRIERDAAAVINAEKVNAMAVAWGQTLNAELKVRDERIATMSAAIEDLREQIASLAADRDKALADKHLWKAWAVDVYDNWPYLRTSTEPPALPANPSP